MPDCEQFHPSTEATQLMCGRVRGVRLKTRTGTPYPFMRLCFFSVGFESQNTVSEVATTVNSTDLGWGPSVATLLPHVLSDDNNDLCVNSWIPDHLLDASLPSGPMDWAGDSTHYHQADLNASFASFPVSETSFMEHKAKVEILTNFKWRRTCCHLIPYYLTQQYTHIIRYTP